MLRVGALYDADPQLAPLWTEALKTKQLAGDIGGNGGRNGGDLGKLAAGLLAPADGARVMMIETGGWDTHSQQQGRLAAQLKGLDSLLAELRTGLGPAWQDTLVLVATEFGRTAAVNGTGGTDHGTASASFLLGGALPKGKPVEAEWPGLAPGALFQGRDLKPTRGLADIVVPALAQHYGIAQGQLGPALQRLNSPETKVPHFMAVDGARLVLVARFWPAGGAVLPASPDRPPATRTRPRKAPHHHQRVAQIDRVVGPETEFAAGLQLVGDEPQRAIVHHPPLGVLGLWPGIGVEQIEHGQSAIGHAAQHFERVAMVDADIGEAAVAHMHQRLRDPVQEGLGADQAVIGEQIGAFGEVLAPAEADLEMQCGRSDCQTALRRAHLALARHRDLRQERLDQRLLRRP